MKEELNEKEIKSIERIALANLQKEIRTILEDLDDKGKIDYVLEKLDYNGLGQLVQS